MGTKRVGWARIRSLINENTNNLRHKTETVETISKDVTLLGSDSGKTYLVNQDGIDVTLPAGVQGANFKFIMAEDFSNAACTVNAPAGEFLAGSATSVIATAAEGLHANGSSHLVCSFSATGKAGDWISVVSNGTLWLVQGACSGAAAIVFSDT